jgi:Glycosyltransferase WbsX
VIEDGVNETFEEAVPTPRIQSRPLPRARLIAFYLPQFHRTPENDRWWGPGFTEWTNVSKAVPSFPGHYQPHIPADLGFYDLRVPETRTAQADLARSHGIEGFCYWHYWFCGKRLLSRPFDEVLESGEPRFPFCLAWANEPWTRTWLGRGDVLQEQRHSPEDDRNHARWLARAFADDRYIRVGGRPLFLVYRPSYLPEPARTTDILREECVHEGVAEPYLVGINAWCSDTDCRTLGFDGTLDFEPQLGNLPDYSVDGPSVAKLRRNLRLGVRSGAIKIYDYSEARRIMTHRRSRYDFPIYPSIVVSWDSSPRRGKRGIVFLHATPERLEEGLRTLVDEAEAKPRQDRLVFINAWNEWAEGNHLEPDMRYGLKRLEAVARVALGPPRPHSDGSAIGRE